MLPGAVSSSDEPIALKASDDLCFDSMRRALVKLLHILIKYLSLGQGWKIFDGRFIDKFVYEKGHLNAEILTDLWTCLIAPRIFVLSKKLACFSTQELRRQLKVIADATAISRLWSDVLCLRFRPKE